MIKLFSAVNNSIDARNQSIAIKNYEDHIYFIIQNTWMNERGQNKLQNNFCSLSVFVLDPSQQIL